MFGLGVAPRYFPAPPPRPMAFHPAPPPVAYRPPYRPLTPGQMLKRQDELRRIHAGAVPPASSAWYANLASRRAMVQQREFQRLLQQNRMLSQQQAALMAQQAALQQVPATPPPASQAPAQMPSSPAAAGGDLTPTQDAHSDEAPASEPEALPHAHNKHLILFVGLAAAAGVGGFIFLKRKKKAPIKP